MLHTLNHWMRTHAVGSSISRLQFVFLDCFAMISANFPLKAGELFICCGLLDSKLKSLHAIYACIDALLCLSLAYNGAALTTSQPYHQHHYEYNMYHKFRRFSYIYFVVVFFSVILYVIILLVINRQRLFILLCISTLFCWICWLFLCLSSLYRHRLSSIGTNALLYLESFFLLISIGN